MAYWGTNSTVLEYVWIVFTADEKFTELKLHTNWWATNMNRWGTATKNWDDILYKMDIELKTNKSIIFTPHKIPRKPWSGYSIVTAIVNSILISSFIYELFFIEGGFLWNIYAGNEYFLLIGGLIVTAGAIFSAGRLYKIGILTSLIGIALIFCSLNLLAILLFGLINLLVLRDAWNYSKWNKLISDQRRNRYHKNVIPKSVCPYCYESLTKPVTSCPYCLEKFTA